MPSLPSRNKIFVVVVKKYAEAVSKASSSCLFSLDRSSNGRSSVRKGVLRNCAKFKEKHLYQSLFFDKVACNFVTNETLAQVFSCEFCKISKNSFSYRRPLGDCFLFDFFASL